MLERFGMVDLATLTTPPMIDLRYATPNNFTGVVLYPAARAWLVASAAMRLVRVIAELAAEHRRLIVWDAYRPPSVQQRMWDAHPDERFIAPPTRGSRHNRGASVDVAIADSDGRLLELPTDFDEFSARAHSAYEGCSAAARANRDRLRGAMSAAGFIGIQDEWWHFDAPDWREHPVLDVPLE
ncbi:MAG: M15 family metallopeptidase [Planctomycetia bacterium]|nr:MAG: M15 family metallopeptidase [Planctomycetia bacterium]